MCIRDREMLDAVEAALPADLFVAAAAVADWRIASVSKQKLKKGKSGDETPPLLALTENPDILRTIAHHPRRPKLVIGFAAETEAILEHAAAKRIRKGCDWILANDVRSETGILGGSQTKLSLITKDGIDPWPHSSKIEAAQRLTQAITAHFSTCLLYTSRCV